MASSTPTYTYTKGNVSSTQTIERMFTTVSNAYVHAAKLPNCIGFCISLDTKPLESKEYEVHFKEGPAAVLDIGAWHSYISDVEWTIPY